jgi:hypothetical protein
MNSQNETAKEIIQSTTTDMGVKPVNANSTCNTQPKPVSYFDTFVNIFKGN